MHFENDRHRLAYVLAAHATTPGGKTRVPVSLRDAILKAILPHGAGLLRSKGGDIVEPSIEEWLDLTGNDFDDDAVVYVDIREPDVVEIAAPSAISAAPPTTDVDDGVLADKILAVMDADEWVGYVAVYDRMHAVGVTSARIDRTMREMAKAGRLERRDGPGRTVEYRPRLIVVGPVLPVTEGRRVLSSESRTAKDVGMYVLMEDAVRHPGQWIRGTDLDRRVTDLLDGTRKKRAAFMLTDSERGTRLWSIGGEPWKVESRDEAGELWLRAVKE
jgi:hypothetical protein